MCLIQESGLTPQQVDSVVAIFDFCAPEGTSLVTLRELKRVLDYYGVAPTRPQMDELVKILGKTEERVRETERRCGCSPPREESLLTACDLGEVCIWIDELCKHQALGFNGPEGAISKVYGHGDLTSWCLAGSPLCEIRGRWYHKFLQRHTDAILNRVTHGKYRVPKQTPNKPMLGSNSNAKELDSLWQRSSMVTWALLEDRAVNVSRQVSKDAPSHGSGNTRSRSQSKERISSKSMSKRLPQNMSSKNLFNRSSKQMGNGLRRNSNVNLGANRGSKLRLESKRSVQLVSSKRAMDVSSESGPLPNVDVRRGGQATQQHMVGRRGSQVIQAMRGGTSAFPVAKGKAGQLPNLLHSRSACIMGGHSSEQKGKQNSKASSHRSGSSAKESF